MASGKSCPRRLVFLAIVADDARSQTYWALMVKNSASLMADITNIFMEEVAPIKNVTGVLPSCVYQPISTAMTSKFSKNGGNPLGITVADGPLNCTSLSFIQLLTQLTNLSDQHRHLLVPCF